MISGHISRAVAAAFFAVATASCFTGIESTPRITGNDVKERNAGMTAEQAFASRIVSQAPSSWTPGKKWTVADSRIGMIFTSASSITTPAPGTVLTLEQVRPVVTVTGENDMEIVLSAPGGAVLYYRTDLSERDWAERPSLPIPFAIEMSAVETADSLMRGNTYYITTPIWYDAGTHAVEGLRHIPVRIVGVAAGTERYPMQVAFTPLAGPATDTRYIYMTYGPYSSATRNFDQLFSFENPRKSYPRIQDDTWDRIIHSQVAEGMTRDECRLALGAPSSIDRGATRGYELERWSYDNGVYLLFEDGLLTRFRK